MAALYKTETHHEQIVTCHDPGLLSSPRRDWMHGRFNRRSPTTCLPGRRLRRAVFHLPLTGVRATAASPAVVCSAASNAVRLTADTSYRPRAELIIATAKEPTVSASSKPA